MESTQMNKNNHLLKKTSLLLATVAIVAAMMVAPSHAYTYTEVAGYDFAASGAESAADHILRTHPTADAANSAVSQTFNVSTSTYLASITIGMSALGTNTLEIGMRLEGCGNNLNADPNGTVYETSTNTYGTDDIEGGGVIHNYTFTFSQTYYMAANTKYAIVIYAVSGSGPDANNCIHVFRDTTAPTDEGYANHYQSSAWSGPYGTEDFVYSVIGVDVFGGGSSGGLPAYEAGDYDTLIENFVSFVVPIAITLIPVILLIAITKSTDKWVILIGLTIGVGLGYFFGVVPIWLVFLVTIGLIGMAYQSVRGGG